MATAVYEAYISDNGTTYQRKSLDIVQTAIGNTAEALGAHARLPAAIKPRYRLGKDAATGREVRCIVGDPTNAVFVSATTLAYPNPRTTGTRTLNLAGAVAEKRYAR